MVIPTYNRAHILQRSIASVLEQTYDNIECIIVDDCSCDNTEQLVTSIIDERVKLIRLDQNSGACVARNTGIQSARGTYIAFNDSDDIWKPHKIEAQLMALNSSEADICFSALERHGYSNSIEIFPNQQTYNTSRIIPFETILGESLAGTPSIFARREVFKSCLFNKNMKCFQDWEWLINASRNHSVYYISEPLVELYLQDDSISNYDLNNQRHSYIQILNRYKNEIQNHPKAHAKLLEGLAYYSALAHHSSSGLLYSAFKMNHNPKTLLKVCFAKMKILGIIYRYKLNKPNYQ